jgi:lipoteichoic acid synthase
VVAGPVVVVDLALAAARATTEHSAGARRLALTALPTNALVHLGVVGLWVALFAATRTGRARALRSVALHVVGGAYLVYTVAAHLYGLRTGSQLDAATLLVPLAHPGLVGDLVTRSTTPGELALLAAVAAYAVGTPLLVRRTTATRPPRTASRSRRAVPVVAGAAAAALVAGVVAPVSSGYARNRGVDLLAGAWHEVRQETRVHAASGPERSPSALVRTEPVPSGERPPNLLVVVLESLRWSATTLADPDLPTTPFLADLATRSTVATRAYTTVPHTSKALTSVHCGIAPPLDTRLAESEPGRVPATCLGGLLGEQGYATAFFQAATGGFERRPELVANLGFEEFRGVEDLPLDGFGPANYFGYEDDVLLGPSAAWMREQDRAGRPFALSLLTVSGHHDYTLPDTFETRRLAEDDELDRYLNTARYVDRFVERLLGELDDLGIADDTVVALVGDHGEGFGEHGLRQHDNTIYEEGVHVPLLVHDPADPRARTVDTPVPTATTLPTVLDALGYGVDGTTPVPLARPLHDAQPDPVHLSCQSANRCLSRVDGNAKYVHHFGHRPDELFDLAADPLERDNLLSRLSRQEAAVLREDVLRWRADVRTSWAPAR